ncbi:unnamed protein product [Fraxinus pennsylvanica]|uniref:Pectinesterase inhibitor domain-containing protein n=1 Tax=Fraxinus pennsylvanica TaxID=56036 RepID=A0AAD1ZRY8_9LAMI|nr:unnamed protein product [Fraxinus pennsylvanica]
MDYTRWLLIFSTWLIIFSFVQPSSSYNPTQELIDAICHKTPDYGFCNDVFNQNLHHLRINTIGLTQIALNQLQKNSTNTRIFIQKKDAAEKNKEIRHLYEICNADYGAVLKVLEKAMKEFASGNYKVMLTYISKSERPVNDCQNIFGGNIEIGLKERSRQVKILVSMEFTAGSLTGL